MVKNINLLQRQYAHQINFIIIGAVNTVIGSLVTITILYFTRNFLQTYVASAVATVICIIISFLSYKLFLFKAKGSYLLYLSRALITYSILIIVNAFTLTILIDYLKVNIIYSQFITLAISSILLYKAHIKYTFKK